MDHGGSPGAMMDHDLQKVGSRWIFFWKNRIEFLMLRLQLRVPKGPPIRLKIIHLILQEFCNALTHWHPMTPVPGPLLESPTYNQEMLENKWIKYSSEKKQQF